MKPLSRTNLADNAADAIRAELREQGVELADAAGGATQWRRV